MNREKPSIDNGRTSALPIGVPELAWQSFIDIKAVEQWLNAQGVGEGPIEHVRLLSGGTQNIIVRFNRAGEAYVLRRPPAHPRPNSNETMRREARVLAALSKSDVPHPKLVAACPTEEILGVAFYVMQAVDGFNAAVNLPPLHAASPEVRRQMGFALIDGIASLGRFDAFEAGLSSLGKLDGFLERQVARWRSQLESYAEYEGWPGSSSVPNFANVAQWLDDHRPTAFDPGLIHGDYHLANVMFRHDGPQLAAIVDWELTTIGDPLIDLGWVLATWPGPSGPQPGNVGVTPWDGFPKASELVDRYARSTSRDMSRIRWYAVLGCYKLGIILEGTYARACAGKADRITGEHLHSQMIALFRRAASFIEVDGPLSVIE